MPSTKPHHRYPLIYVIAEDGEGLLTHMVGWEISRDKDMVCLAAKIDCKDDAEWVTESYNEIPTTNIVTEEVLRDKW